MRFAAVILLSVATAAPALAQSRPASVGFEPIPDKLPILLFAPDSLAGTLLRPLAQASPPGLPEVKPEPALALADPEGDNTVAEAVAQAEGPAVQTPEPAITGTAGPEAMPEPETDAASAAPEAPAEPDVAIQTPQESEPPKTDPNASTVTVIVENVESAAGTVNVAVCNRDLSREGCPYVQEIPAAQGFVETEFRDIPPGTYAVVGYHDVNGNDTFDKLFGMPREPYALSSKAGEKLVPTFTDAALSIKSGENAVIIRLKRLGG
jgi:uncharacterized protein (DUF2141 family)